MSQGKDVYGDYATLPVPKEELRSTLNIFMVYMGVLAVIAAIFAGSGLAQMYDLRTTIVVALIGNILLAIFGGLIAYIGGVTRANTYMLLRYPLGKIGAAIGSLIVSALPLIIWFAVETWLFAITVNVIYPGHPLTTIVASSIWGGILMMITAYIGYKALAVLSYITVPFWYTLIVIGFAAAVDLNGGFESLWRVGPSSIAPLGIGITYVFGLYAAGCVITSDVSRYGIKRWSGSIAWALHVAIFMTALLFAGAAMTLLTGAPNVIVAIAQIGLGVGALLLAILGQWTTNDNNLWSAALAWINITGKFQKKVWVLITGIIGTIISALWGGLWGMSLDPFISFGTLLGNFIPPVGAVLIADYYIVSKSIVKRDYRFSPGTKISLVNIPGILSMFIGGFIGWISTTYGVHLPTGVGVADSIITSFILYLLLVVAMHKLNVKFEVGEWIVGETGI
ncbi:MAG: cytosine permease [Ignisphaera sp.]|uniref:Cytosine permease n=1 Tax=Ignisphaera aggregans TaxID=334771 RepID=A0A7J3I8B9_9CREN